MNNTTIKNNDYKSEDYAGVSPPDGQGVKPNNEDYVPDLSVDGQEFRRACCQMGEIDNRISSNEITSSVMEEGGQDSAQTTNFTYDAVTVSSVPLSTARLPEMYTRTSDQNNVEDLKAFLGKPYLWQSDVLQNSDNQGTFPVLELPIDIFSVPMYKNKLDGFLGIRFTTVVRFIINGNPFQQGRYMLHYVPFGGAPTSSKRTAWYGAHTNTLYERTQLRRIELDVCCDTEGTMKIPFSSAMNYYPIHSTSDATKLGSLGYLRVAPYLPVTSTTGSAYVNYSVYVSFEDVELIGAAVPQMGHPSVIDKEQKAAMKGPVSSTIFAFSKAASAISEIPVPVISDFAGTVAWALGIAGNTAKAFGFAKPPDNAPVNNMVVKTARYVGAVDGFDGSTMLAGSSENQVALIPGVASTDADEMNLLHIATIPAWFNTYEWATSNIKGSALATFSMEPISYLQNNSYSGVVVTNYTPVAWVSEHFSAWRGSFVYKLKIVKTGFHSGRVAICFYPSTFALTTGKSTTYADSDYVHREIIDIRSCSDVEFVVPYVSDSAFQELGDSFGKVVIYVVDPLVAPSSVPSSIYILAEVAAGPDFEWARPANNPYHQGTTGAGLFCNATPQMGEPQLNDACAIVSTSIGSTDPRPMSTTINAEICIGEKILSFRSLLKIFRLQRFHELNAAAAVTSFIPSGINVVYHDAALIITFGDCQGDLYDEVGACFLYSRGSMRVKYFTAGSATANYICSSGDLSVSSPHILKRGAGNVLGTTLQFNYDFINGRSAWSKANLEGAVEIAVPQYTLRHSRNNISEMSNATTGYNYSSSADLGSGGCVNLIYNPTLPIGIGESFAIPIFRAVGDDFSFHEFVSTVPTQRYGGGYV